MRAWQVPTSYCPTDTFYTFIYAPAASWTEGGALDQASKTTLATGCHHIDRAWIYHALALTGLGLTHRLKRLQAGWA